MGWLRRLRYTKRMEDKKKIDSILADLKNTTGHIWEPAEGFNTMISVNRNSTGGFDTNNSKGVTVKVFVNTVTGEIKLFYFENVI